MNELAALRAYWEALREGGVVPRRAQIDPRGIESALDIAFLAERIAPGVARLRVAGTHLNDLMGMEVAGMPLSALVEPESRAVFATALEAVFAGPSIAELAVRARTRLGRPALEGRMLLLPLRAEDGSVTRALGGLVVQGTLGAAPRRLTLLSHRVTPTGGALRSGAPAPAPGFAEPAAPFGDRPAPAGRARDDSAERPRGRPELRVIRNPDFDG